MAFLKLRDEGVKEAIRKCGLDALTRIGRGTFAAVYDKGDTVMKLTADRTFYELHSWYTQDNPHFATVIAEHGCVGVQQSTKTPLYLIEVEKLRPLQNATENKKLARALCKAARMTMISRGDVVRSLASRGLIDHSRIVPETLFQMADSKDLPIQESLREALRQIGSFSMDYDGVGLDFHQSNIMERVSDGTLVLCDPVCDVLLNY